MCCSARLLDFLRFEYLFEQGERNAVLDALRVYQNRDGGFGRMLEPDFRGPVSQPLCVDVALRVLDELGALEPALVTPTLAFLAQHSASDGGIPNVLPSARDYARAPWWQPAPAQPGCLLPTASIAGLLHKHGVEHAWREGASAFCLQAIAELPIRIAHASTRLEQLWVLYESRASVTFLDHAPDRARARALADQLGHALRSAQLIDAESEAGSPVDLAPHPQSLARSWFSDGELEAALDQVVASQQQDGGFSIAWAVWNPLSGLEWRGEQTVARLKMLRAYGRL